MPRIEVTNLNNTKPKSRYLRKYREKIFSQYGEEGIIKKIMSIIGENRKWCVEFGAWDGIHLSNTCHFIKDLGWNAVQIEGNRNKFKKLRNNFSDFPLAHQRESVIGFEKGVDTIDVCLMTTDIPKDFEFISIDVDGVDYYVWESITVYRPRLVVIEFNPSVPNDVIFVQDRDMRISQGCSLAALIELGKAKGYELILAHRCNAYFIVTELFPMFGIKDNSITAMKPNSRGRIWGGYDGKIYNTLGVLPWKGHDVAEDTLQILSNTDQRWGDAVWRSSGD